MWKLNAKLTIVIALGAFASLASASDPIPRELTSIVSKVHAAAAHRDYVTLRANMDAEFTWSFGGDGDPEQALAEWQKDSRYLKNLVKVTRDKCGWIDGGVYQCPAKAGLAFRAGFKQVKGTWKMVYFVAGD